MSFCTNCGNQNPDTSKFCTTCGAALFQSPNKSVESVTPQSQPASVQSSELQKNFEEAIETIKRLAIEHKKILIGMLGLIVVFIIVYNLFLKANPINDAKKIASGYCDCSTKYNDALIEVNEDFVKSFSSNNFKKRQEARIKLQELQNPINISNTECNSKAQANYIETRNKYITNEEQLKKFDFAYTAQQGACNPDNQSKLTSTYSEIEGKISTIKDPEPDIEKIKSDLIGKNIPGWNFKALSEIDQAKISNTIHGSDRIEYTIDLHLVGLSSKDPHDAKIIVTYLRNQEDWYFSDIKEAFITYTNTAPVNNWFLITPLQNCTYSIIENGQKYWIQEGSFGSKYKGGGSDADAHYFRSNQIYLMSREDHPVDLVFKYTPNN